MEKVRLVNTVEVIIKELKRIYSIQKDLMRIWKSHTITRLNIMN